jgi:drug/metabolite transporter (DMT)-like permease
MGRANAVRMGFLALMWGSSFLWIKIGLRGVSPAQMVLARLLFGSAVLVVMVRASRLPLPRGRVIWRRLFLAAAFANVLPFTLFAVGERSVDSAVAGVLNGTTPLFVVVISLLIPAEPLLSTRRLVGLAIGFAGTLLIFEPWQAGTSITSWGGLACLGAAASYGVSFVYMGRRLANQGVPPLALSAGQLLAATVLAAAVIPFAGLQPVHLRWDVLGAVAMLGIFGTGGAYVLNYRLIVEEGAAATAAVAYLLPVVSVLLGAAVLGDPITLHVVLGMVLVLAGVALAQRRVSAPTPGSAPAAPPAGAGGSPPAAGRAAPDPVRPPG